MEYQLHNLLCGQANPINQSTYSCMAEDVHVYYNIYQSDQIGHEK